jgi:hypothetical protein
MLHLDTHLNNYRYRSLLFVTSVVRILLFSSIDSGGKGGCSLVLWTWLKDTRDSNESLMKTFLDDYNIYGKYPIASNNYTFLF